MVKKFVCFMIIVITMLNVSCETNTSSLKYSSAKETIDTFLQNFETNKSKYQLKQAELIDISSQGGMVIGYYEDGKLKYIESAIFGETGKILYDIYFINNSLVYFIETDIKYDKTIYDEDFKIMEKNVKEYIINNDTMYQYNEKLILLDEGIKSKYVNTLNDFKKILLN